MKNKFLLPFLILIVIIIVIPLIVPKKNTSPIFNPFSEPTPTPIIATFNTSLPTIIPGKTTKQELLNLLGNPQKIQKQSGYDIFSYAHLTKDVSTTDIYIKNNQVIFTTEEPKTQILNTETVTPPIYFYSPTDQSHTSWQVFVDQGYAILVTNKNTVQRILHFTPSSLEVFQQQTQPIFNFSTTPYSFEDTPDATAASNLQ